MNPEYGKYPKIFDALNKTETKFPDRLLVGFTRILDNVESLWGSKKANHYLDNLLLEDRDDRAGFPADVLNAIWLLKQVHESQFPKLGIDVYDPFSNPEVSGLSGIQSFKPPTDHDK